MKISDRYNTTLKVILSVSRKIKDENFSFLFPKSKLLWISANETRFSHLQFFLFIIIYIVFFVYWSMKMYG